jgi:hypothetical protein
MAKFGPQSLNHDPDRGLGDCGDHWEVYVGHEERKRDLAERRAYRREVRLTLEGLVEKQEWGEMEGDVWDGLDCQKCVGNVRIRECAKCPDRPSYEKNLDKGWEEEGVEDDEEWSDDDLEEDSWEDEDWPERAPELGVIPGVTMIVS